MTPADRRTLGHALTKAEHDAIAAHRRRPLTQDPIRRRPHNVDGDPIEATDRPRLTRPEEPK